MRKMYRYACTARDTAWVLLLHPEIRYVSRMLSPFNTCAKGREREVDTFSRGASKIYI
jgi:hypothetical protein